MTRRKRRLKRKRDTCYNTGNEFLHPGEGVPTDEKEKIFEWGFGKNAGLGLAFSREILPITGITINETGESGKGARFEIVVPKELFR